MEWNNWRDVLAYKGQLIERKNPIVNELREINEEIGKRLMATGQRRVELHGYRVRKEEKWRELEPIDRELGRCEERMREGYS